MHNAVFLKFYITNFDENIKLLGVIFHVRLLPTVRKESRHFDWNWGSWQPEIKLHMNPVA